MSHKDKMPHDIEQACLWVVRGYDRRVRAYYDAVYQVEHGTYCADGSGGRPIGIGRPCETKAEALAEIDGWPETKRMRAVEQALHAISCDVVSEEQRKRLRFGIMLNCESGRKYPFEYLSVDCVSRMDFYRRRKRFLREIAKFLCLV